MHSSVLDMTPHRICTFERDILLRMHADELTCLRVLALLSELQYTLFFDVVKYDWREMHCRRSGTVYLQQ